jgi:ankyrin repeat protein
MHNRRIIMDPSRLSPPQLPDSSTYPFPISDAGLSGAMAGNGATPANVPGIGTPPPASDLPPYTGGISAAVPPSITAPVQLTSADTAKRAETIENMANAGIAAFRQVARAGNYQAVCAFIEAGMPVDAVSTGATAQTARYPIAEAAEAGALDVVTYMIGAGAGKEARSQAFAAALIGFNREKSQGRNPADHARVARALLQSSPDNERELLVACAKTRLGNIADVVDYLLRTIPIEKAIPDFMDAAMTGKLEVVKMYIDLGMPANVCPYRDAPVALNEAARKGHVDVVTYLLSQGADEKDLKETLIAILYEIPFQADTPTRTKFMQTAAMVLRALPNAEAKRREFIEFYERSDARFLAPLLQELKL